MPSPYTAFLLWIAALSSGLIGGVYFAFSAFIMKAFARIKPAQSIVAMKSINQVILHSMFMPLFFGSSIISVLLIIIGLNQWGKTDAELILLTGLVYFFGMFVCTALFNVPLNNTLASLDPNGVNAARIWANYLKTWTNWNHLRALCSLGTSALCIWILSTL